jgi:hypothetical protein
MAARKISSVTPWQGMTKTLRSTTDSVFKPMTEKMQDIARPFERVLDQAESHLTATAKAASAGMEEFAQKMEHAVGLEEGSFKPSKRFPEAGEAANVIQGRARINQKKKKRNSVAQAGAAAGKAVGRASIMLGSVAAGAADLVLGAAALATRPLQDDIDATTPEHRWWSPLHGWELALPRGQAPNKKTVPPAVTPTATAQPALFAKPDAAIGELRVEVADGAPNRPPVAATRQRVATQHACSRPRTRTIAHVHTRTRHPSTRPAVQVLEAANLPGDALSAADGYALLVRILTTSHLALPAWPFTLVSSHRWPLTPDGTAERGPGCDPLATLSPHARPPSPPPSSDHSLPLATRFSIPLHPSCSPCCCSPRIRRLPPTGRLPSATPACHTSSPPSRRSSRACVHRHPSSGTRLLLDGTLRRATVRSASLCSIRTRASASR